MTHMINNLPKLCEMGKLKARESVFDLAEGRGCLQTPFAKGALKRIQKEANHSKRPCIEKHPCGCFEAAPGYTRKATWPIPVGTPACVQRYPIRRVRNVKSPAFPVSKLRVQVPTAHAYVAECAEWRVTVPGR